MSDDDGRADPHSEYLLRFRRFKPQYQEWLTDVVETLDKAKPGQALEAIEFVAPLIEQIAKNACRLGIPEPLALREKEHVITRSRQLVVASPIDVNYTLTYVLSRKLRRGDKWAPDPDVAGSFPDRARDNLIMWLHLWQARIARMTKPGFRPVGRRNISAITVFGTASSKTTDVNTDPFRTSAWFEMNTEVKGSALRAAGIDGRIRVRKTGNGKHNKITSRRAEDLVAPHPSGRRVKVRNASANVRQTA